MRISDWSSDVCSSDLYNIVDMDYRVSGNNRVRVLKKLDVDEVSPVLRGAGIGTRTIAIKSAKLREEHFASLITGLGEMATAIDDDPAAVSDRKSQSLKSSP